MFEFDPIWFQIIYLRNADYPATSPTWGGQGATVVSGISIKDAPSEFADGYGMYLVSRESKYRNCGKYVNKTYSWYVTVNGQYQLNGAGEHYRWLAIG